MLRASVKIGPSRRSGASWFRGLLTLAILLTCESRLLGETGPGLRDPSDLEVVCRIPTIDAWVGYDTVIVPVILTNNSFQDSIGACDLWVNISHPEFYRFERDTAYWLIDSVCHGYDGDLCTLWYYDTLCEVWSAPYSLENTLAEDWELISVQVFEENAGSMRLRLQADLPDSVYTPSFPMGMDTLIKVFAHTNGFLDDSLVGDCLEIALDMDPETSEFFDSDGEQMGCGSYQLVIDTLYMGCTEWVGDSCVAWQYYVIDSSYHCIVDTNSIKLYDGVIEVKCCDCLPGDADWNMVLNISDVVSLILYIFGNHPPPITRCNGDFNCDCVINITDVVRFIRLMFDGETFHCLDCEEWSEACGDPWW